MKLATLAFFLLIISACTPTADDMALGTGTLTISPTDHAMRVNATHQFIAKFIDARGDEQSNINITWSSSDTTIAEIAEDGTVTSKAIGQTEIVAQTTTDGSGVTNSNIAILTVEEDNTKVATIKIQNSDTTLMVGDTLQLMANTKNVNNQDINTAAITWISSDDSIASIDADGLLTAFSSGEITISASSESIQSSAINLIIQENITRVATMVGKKGHNSAGTATLKLNDQGVLEIVFSDDFFVTNGPGLEIFLSDTEVPTAASKNVGDWKKIQGAQTYVVPGNVAIEQYDLVVIYCVPYKVLFASGILQ